MRKLLVLLTIVIASCSQQQEDNLLQAKLDEYLTGQAKFFRFNGNVLVAENGKIIFQRSYGFADFDTERLLNDSTVFELASVSKQFTATGILLLKDKGKLRLTDSLRQYFPELPYAGITLWHMLTHTSGLPDYEEAMNKKWDRTKVAFNADMIAFLAKEKMPVIFAPGSKWEYSNTAYALLATIIEKVSGQTFKNYMASNIFQPLGMKHTRIYNTRRSLKDTIANYAYGFIYHDSLKKHILPDHDPQTGFVIYLDGIQGDGVVNSTTADLLKWDRAVKNHTLLKAETQNEMLKEQALVDTLKRSHYGFGLFMEKTELGYIIAHSGGWPGYTTYLGRNRDKDQTYIVLSNNSSGSPVISKALAHIMAGKPVVMPYEHKAITLDSASIVPFLGKYKGPGEINLELKENKLYASSGNGKGFELKAETANKFFFSNGSDRQLEFELDSSKQITKAWLIAYGVKTPLKKME